jgi:hypothetical protein
MHFSCIIILKVHVPVEDKSDDTEEDIELVYSSNSIINVNFVQNLVPNCKFENVLSAILAMKFLTEFSYLGN